MRPQKLRRRVLLATAAAALALAMAACGGLPSGSALDTSDMENLGLATIRPGTEIGINFAIIYNKESAPITILTVKLVGTGLGSIVRPVQTNITIGRGSLPRSAYIEDPPVEYFGNGKCGVQSLRRVSGYVLRPHTAVTVWTVLLGLRPGKFHITGNVVSYKQADFRFQQTVHHGYHGRVKAHAPLLRATQDGSRQCLHLTRLLKGTLP